MIALMGTTAGWKACISNCEPRKMTKLLLKMCSCSLAPSSQVAFYLDVELIQVELNLLAETARFNHYQIYTIKN